MKKYFEVLKDTIPGITIDDLYAPLGETGIHSLDSIILRDTLESHFGQTISDNDWYRFNTLSETLDYLASRGPHSETCTLNREQEIRLPQMINSALSESWLLKEMGDMHWEMLSDGLKQKSSELTDSCGNRLYAAFVRINYSVSPLNHYQENETLHLGGGIRRFGDYAYYSNIDGTCGEKRLSARMMTSFSARSASDNKQLSKSKLFRNGINQIEELEQTPDFYTEHRMMKKGMITEINSGGNVFKITDAVIESMTHTINPYYEINGVGLLYFAAYPLIADQCAASFLTDTMELADYNQTYYTTYRDICYFANCNAADRIRVNLNTLEHLPGNRLKMTVSMYRESDNKLMARVMTIKQKG